MPLITRVWVKIAFANLLMALGLALANATLTAFADPALHYALQMGITHLLVVGWLTQLIFGVAWWLFPPISPEMPRGDERPIWLAMIALNLGLFLRLIGEPLQALRPESPEAAGALLLSAALQELAALIFVFRIWGRVRDPKRRSGGT